MTQLTEQHNPAAATGSGPSQPNRPAPKSARLALIVLAILLLAGGFSIARRLTERGALAKETEKLAVPTVGVTRPSTEPASDQLALPAQLQAYVESAIFARTNGYLLRWTKDIGSHGNKG